MARPRSSTPWPPRLPARFPLFVAGNEYRIKFRGRQIYVAGKVSPDQALLIWNEKRRVLLDASRVYRSPTSMVTVGDLCNLYASWLAERVKGGHGRKPIAQRSYNRAIGVLKLLGKVLSPGTYVVDLEPGDFTRFSSAIPGKAASTRTPYVAYVRAMFKWGVDNGHVDRQPRYGSDFARPRVQTLMQERDDVVKSYTPAELRELRDRIPAGDVRLAWLYLGINCAFANTDIATLPRSVVLLDDPVPRIDFRRGKTKIGRVAPLMPETVAAMRAYRRPDPQDPADDRLFFLGQNGKPLVRDVAGNRELQTTNVVDEVGKGWSRLWPKLRPGRKYSPRVGARPFSGLRTTFATVADPWPDQLAVDVVMGHRSSQQATTRRRWYVERLEVARIVPLVEHVWSVVFGEPRKVK
jgi:hypothetical protein